MTSAWRALSADDQAPWQPLVGPISDAAGRFVIELESDANLEFSVAPPGLAMKRWSGPAQHSATGRDLGDVVLEPGAVLTVSLADTRGDLLTRGWSILTVVDAAYEVTGAEPRLQRSYWSVTPLDAALGSARLSNLPKGHVHVLAQSPDGLLSNTVSVETHVGKSDHVQLLYDGPDPASLVVLDVRTPRALFGDELFLFALAADGTQNPLLVDPRGMRRSPAGGWSTRVRGTVEGRGPWTLETRDPRARVTSQPELRPGVRLTVDLVGSAKLALTVVDAESGRPIDAPTIEVHEIWVNSALGGTHNYSPKEVFGGAQTDFVPGAYRVSVAAATFAESELFLHLAPNAVHSERVELRRPVAYTGRVVDTDGAPVAGASVSVERGQVVTWNWIDSKLVATTFGEQVIEGPPFATTQTGTDGRFALAGLAPGPLTFRVERNGMPHDVLHTTHEGSAEQVLRVAAPTRIEVQISFPLDAEPPALGVVLDAPEHPEVFAELDPGTLEVVPVSITEPASYHAVLFASAGARNVTVVRAEGTGATQRWIPVGTEYFVCEVEVTSHVRFDGRALMPATVRLSAGSTASPAVTSLRGAWLALGLQRAGDGGEPWRRWGHPLLPPPPPSLAAQALEVSVKVPAGDYARFVGGPGWRYVTSEPLRFALRQSIDVGVDADPPLVAREVRLEAEDGTPLATTGVQLWFEGVHPLPPGERLIPVTALTDEAGRLRAIGPVGASLHASVARNERGAVVHTRPNATIGGALESHGSAVMALSADMLVLTVRAP